MEQPPKSFFERFSPQVEDRIKKDNPDMPEGERKAKSKEFLTVSWGRFSDKKRAEFSEPKTDVPKGEGFDKMFEGIFGGSKNDDRDLLSELLDW